MDSSRKRKWTPGASRSVGRKARRVLQFTATQRRQLPFRFGRRTRTYRPPMQYLSEVHQIDNIGDRGSIVFLNNCPVGTALGTRHTQKVRWTSILLSGNVKLGTEANTHNMYQWVFVWLVFDKRPGITNPSPSDIFSGTVNEPETWVKNLNNGDRFVICLKKKYSLIGGGYNDAQMTDAAPSAKVPYYPYMKSRPVEVYKSLSGVSKFKDVTSGDVDDMEQGAYYLVVATFHGYNCSMSLNKRMYFRSI